MKWLALAFVLLFASPAHAHVGSPDVFFEGEAGPYKLFVTVRMPQVIPGVATIEIRSESPDVTGMTVVPMRLTGAGSELPPVPDPTVRSASDPQFFTADLWLMERGSLQVRIDVTGARGAGVLRVPVPAAALKTLGMDRGLGTLLLVLMSILSLGLVAIAAGAAREAALEPGNEPDARARRRTKIAAVIAGVLVIGALAGGKFWWNAEAATYEQMTQKPWHVETTLEPCVLTIKGLEGTALLPDHGHEMHLFLVRFPELDHLAHLHPQRVSRGELSATLPSLPAGSYKLYADVVLAGGFPITGTADLTLPEQSCAPLAGDDAVWTGNAELGDGMTMTFERPAHLRTGEAQRLKLHVDGGELEPYMGMAGHAEILARDGSVFAHIHPSGSVAMPALELAQGGDMPGMQMPDTPSVSQNVPPDLAFPFGFPKPGDYKLFVQVKHAGHILTGVFDAHVE